MSTSFLSPDELRETAAGLLAQADRTELETFDLEYDESVGRRFVIERRSGRPVVRMSDKLPMCEFPTIASALGVSITVLAVAYDRGMRARA